MRFTIRTVTGSNFIISIVCRRTRNKTEGEHKSGKPSKDYKTFSRGMHATTQYEGGGFHEITADN